MRNTDDVLIRLEGVSKTYRRGSEEIAALRDASLDVRRGELLAVVGPSGAGKTTLTQIIGGLVTPDAGTVTVDGKRLSRRSDRALSRYRGSTVGFIFQNFSLLPYYTALENVCVPLVIAGVPGRRRRQLARRYLEMVGLEKRMGQRADKLSGGERQRVSIARALVHKPKIIIADEPTGSLDTARGLEIMQILTQLSHEQHITVVVVTHDPTLAARADRVVRIRDGRLEIAEARHAGR